MQIRQIINTFSLQIPVLSVQVLDHVTGLHLQIDLGTVINFTVDIKPFRLFLCVTRGQLVRMKYHIHYSTANNARNQADQPRLGLR